MAVLLADLGEFGWLDRLLPRLGKTHSFSKLRIPVGDDAAAFAAFAHSEGLVVTTDAFVEDVHFKRSWMSWFDVGRKALAVNVSDLAAMGAVTPVGAVITAALPKDTTVADAQRFADGLLAGAKQWKVALVGGDTVRSTGKWMISITVFGKAKAHHLVRRSGAKEDDVVLSSGYLGLARAGLEILESGRKKERWMRPLLQAFLRPEPRLNLGRWLAERGLATSLLDCSDGLEASLVLLSKASRRGMEIDLNPTLVHPALQTWAARHRADGTSYVRSGGEEYELIFTASPKAVSRIQKAWPAVQVLGRVVRTPGVRTAGDSKPWVSYGYAHFKK